MNKRLILLRALAHKAGNLAQLRDTQPPKQTSKTANDHPARRPKIGRDRPIPSPIPREAP